MPGEEKRDLTCEDHEIYCTKINDTDDGTRATGSTTIEFNSTKSESNNVFLLFQFVPGLQAVNLCKDSNSDRH